MYTWALTHGYQSENPGSGAGGNDPINGINWHDAVKRCNARLEMEGLVPAYNTDGTHASVFRTGVVDLTNACVDWGVAGDRLPTEAEWERAARGGNSYHAFLAVLSLASRVKECDARPAST